MATDEQGTTTSVPSQDESKIHLVTEDRVTVRNGYRQRTARIEFGGDFDGLWAEVKVRAPYKFVRMLSDDERIPDALAELIVGHNLPDAETGDQLPNPIGAQDIELLDFGLVVKIVEQTVEAIRKAGNLGRR